MSLQNLQHLLWHLQPQLWYQIGRTTNNTQRWNKTDIRAVYTRENKPQIGYVSHELSHLYGHSLSKELIRGLRKPWTTIGCKTRDTLCKILEFSWWTSHHS